MDIQGRIKMIDETKAFGANGFRKREVVITTDEQYPQHILVEFTQDKCDLLNSYRVGEPVKVGINIRGREWVNPQGETKYFNSIQAWKIDRLQQQGGYQQQPYNGQGSAVDNYHNQHQMQNNPQQANSTPPAEDHDDLPF